MHNMFRHVAVLTFAVLVCRRFDHTLTSSGHAHLRYDTACRVTRERSSDVAENLGVFCTGQGNDFELIPTVKIETRQPVQGYFSSEFSSIYNHCGVMDAWSRKTLKIFEKFMRLKQTTPYGKIFKLMFRKFSSRHRSTCCVQISWNLADGQRLNRALLTWQKWNFAWLSSCRYCGNRA